MRTIPRPVEPGDETWGGIPYEKRSHVGTWMVPSYDPELNLYYFGTGDGVPRLRAPHPNADGEDSLYTASIVALNPDTGKMVWYFQHLPIRPDAATPGVSISACMPRCGGLHSRLHSPTSASWRAA